MKIIIVGCGNVGTTLAGQLSTEGHNVTVVDEDDKAVRNAASKFDLMGIIGNGATLGVLKEAGVEDCDLMIAVTGLDERNLLSCLIARKAGNCNTIARVRNPQYSKEISIVKDELGLSMIINPEYAAAGEIARLIKFPSAIEIDAFAKGRVELLKVPVCEGSPLCGMALRDMHSKLNCDILVCVVEREEKALIPDGNFVLEAGDKISFVASPKKAAAFFRTMKIFTGSARSTVIVGGGETAFYLASQLISMGIEVKIIEKDKKRCDALSELLPEAVVICGDGTDKELLMEEGIQRTASFVSLTNFDEENIMISMYAQRINPKTKIVTKVHRDVYDEIITSLGLGSIINPKLITGESIVKFVRAMQNSLGSNIETLYKLSNNKVEALEFLIKDNSDLIGKPLMELHLKPNVLICCIIHNGVIETPRGQSQIQKGDTVIVVTTETGFDDIGDILR